jgi:hypothetical protein
VYLRRLVQLSCFALLPFLTACNPAQQAWWGQLTAWHLSGSSQSVADCIKGVESGNYTEQSHIYEGSGAYQFIPSTWRYWYGRWRDAVAFVGSDYPYAYLAPPLIQDAVLAYTLANGGASNWSGVDGCTGY